MSEKGRGLTCEKMEGACRNILIKIIIKFPYNAHSDWPKQRALLENRERGNDGKLAFEFLLRNFDKFDPN